MSTETVQNRRLVDVLDENGQLLKPTKKLDMIKRKVKNNTLEIVQCDENGFPILVKFKKRSKKI